jgi:hypothetical protein
MPLSISTVMSCFKWKAFEPIQRIIVYMYVCTMHIVHTVLCTECLTSTNVPYTVATLIDFSVSP